MKASILLFISILGFQSLATANCPKRSGKSELTLNQVMYHFGRSVRISDTAIRMGLRDPASVGVTPIQDSIDVITIAEDCCQAVLDDKSGEMLPHKVNKMAPAEKDAFLKRYADLMVDFKKSLADYRSLFTPLLSTPGTLASFQALEAKQKDVMDKANAAHKELADKNVDLKN